MRRITYHVGIKIEGELGDVIEYAVPQEPAVPTLEQLLSTMANLAFIVETVAHLRGKEEQLLPSADLARKQIAALQPRDL